MNRVREVIVVEGRYDKNALSQAVSATILETSGFSVFKDAELVGLLRRLAASRGLIILTDSDGAGFMIRNYLKGALPEGRVKHAYIPDIYGKERRKAKRSGEGKLGVEGMRPEVLVEALRRAGATFEGEETLVRGGGITGADLYECGLVGTEGSAVRRKALQKELGLPERLSSKALLDVLNALFSRAEFLEEVRKLDENGGR